MTIFAAKPVPSSDKLRGGYYTPEPIARFVASWVATSGPRLLEPSCGDGAILQHLAAVPNAEAQGVELLREEADKARRYAPVAHTDFFTWFRSDQHGAYDGVAGNPPYIRFGSWDEQLRAPALALMERQGLKPSRYTNAWVPFVVASVLAVRPGGRVGLVIPAELLQVGYAAQLRAWLVDHCAAITVVSFEKLVFPGILQEVVLLLAERGEGPARIGTVEVRDAFDLDRVDPSSNASVRAPLHAGEKWTKYYLPAEDIELVRDLRTAGKLVPLDSLVAVNVGVVTGRNSFFCMTADDARRRDLSDVTVPIVSRSFQLAGLRFDDQDMASLDAAGATTRLLSFDGTHTPATNEPLSRYIELGEAEGVHTGYKCRIRPQWWKVPSVKRPDGFMLRQISTHPRIIANHTDATSTDTVHRVFAHAGTDVSQLSIAAFNSVTFALAEVVGRSYGGGILELEPSEAAELLVPPPSLVSEELGEAVDRLVRSKQIDAALDLVDREVLERGLGLSSYEIGEFRRVWKRLRDRRTGRSTKRSSSAEQDAA